MWLKKLASVAALAFGLSMTAGTAQAYSTYSFEDDDIDFILSYNATTDAYTTRTSGTIAVGDIFVSVFEIPVFTINSVNALPAGQELTGVAAIQLQAIIGTGGVGTVYVFGAVTQGLNDILGLGTVATSVADGDAGEGAVLAMWLNGTGDFNLDLNRSTNPATNCISLADCLYRADTGSLFQVDGFTGDTDEFWVAVQTSTGGNNIATVLATNNNALIAAVNAGLGNFFNAWGPIAWIDIATGLPCINQSAVNGDGCVQFSGSGTITGGQGLTNGAVAHSDFDGQKLTTVPEPGTLVLLGMGLLGLGFMSRRRSV
jgi:hypothetical protein